MTSLSQHKLETISGGSLWGFCKAYTGALAAVGLGAAIGLYSNPITGTAATAAAAVGVGCWLLTL